MAREIEEVRQRREALYHKQQIVVGFNHRFYVLGEETVRPQMIEAQQQVIAAERELLLAEKAVERITPPEARLAVQEQGIEDVASTFGNHAGRPEVSSEQRSTRGIRTTGLDIDIKPCMTYVPTGIYHLLNPMEDPLVECVIRSGPIMERSPRQARRVRLTAYIENYSARVVETVEVPTGQHSAPIRLLPTLFPERVSTLYEMTRATLNVLAEDLDTQKVEVHRTRMIWLLARNAAAFEIRDPQTGDKKDLRHLLGAYVTPNHPGVQQFLQQVAASRSDRRLAGKLDGAFGQAAAIYETLKTFGEITYVHTTLAFNPTLGALGQRVRLPHETLAERQANCLDGTLLFVSLLEALGLEPAIVLVPNHALVAWRTGPGEAGWRYLETSRLADRHCDFDTACEVGTATALLYRELQDNPESVSGSFFRRLEVSELRSLQIMPMA